MHLSSEALHWSGLLVGIIEADCGEKPSSMRLRHPDHHHLANALRLLDFKYLHLPIPLTTPQIVYASYSKGRLEIPTKPLSTTHRRTSDKTPPQNHHSQNASRRPRNHRRCGAPDPRLDEQADGKDDWRRKQCDCEWTLVLEEKPLLTFCTDLRHV